MIKINKAVIMMVAVLVMPLMAGCGGGVLNKTVRAMLLQGDTTETSFNQLCELIRADERSYGEYIDAQGEHQGQARDRSPACGHRNEEVISWD